jgi:hypothetical protein
MSAVRDAVTNLISAIESGTPSTRYDNTYRWRHEPRAFGIEQIASLAQPTRVFTVEPAGDRERDGRMAQPGNPQGAIETWVITIAYRCGDNPHEFRLVIAEDEQYLADRVQHPSLWGTPQKVQQRAAGPATLTEPEGFQSGAVAILEIPVRFKYRPTFSL